jgi:hypothetical protein
MAAAYSSETSVDFYGTYGVMPHNVELLCAVQLVKALCYKPEGRGIVSL